MWSVKCSPWPQRWRRTARRSFRRLLETVDAKNRMLWDLVGVQRGSTVCIWSAVEHCLGRSSFRPLIAITLCTDRDPFVFATRFRPSLCAHAQPNIQHQNCFRSIVVCCSTSLTTWKSHTSGPQLDLISKGKAEQVHLLVCAYPDTESFLTVQQWILRRSGFQRVVCRWILRL